jgi:hypothetical protein
VEGVNSLRRRRTDGDGREWERRARRRVAEAAYGLFVGLGCDRAMEQECWHAAEQWIVGIDGAVISWRPDATDRAVVPPPIRR